MRSDVVFGFRAVSQVRPSCAGVGAAAYVGLVNVGVYGHFFTFSNSVVSSLIHIPCFLRFLFRFRITR